MSVRTFGFFLMGLVVTCAVSATASAAIQLNFGATVDDSNTDTPGHVVGPITSTSWNLFTTADGNASGTDLNGAVNIMVDLGEESGSTTNILDWSRDGGDLSNSALGNADDGLGGGVPWVNSNTQSATFTGGVDEREIGVRIGGLAPGLYDFYVVAKNTNVTEETSGGTPATETYNVISGTVASGSGNTDYSSGFNSVFLPNNIETDAWVDGQTFILLEQVQIDTGQDFVIITQGLTGGEERGFINTIQIVNVIPEPATAGLLGLAAVALLRRRRAA